MTGSTAKFSESLPVFSRGKGRTSSRPTSGTALRVVIVDSHPGDFAKLRRKLMALGYSVLAISSVKAALKAAMTDPPALWMVGMHLPGIDANEMVPMLRWCQPQAIICLIGDQDCVDDEIAARRAGPELYIAKPIELQSVLEAVEELITV